MKYYVIPAHQLTTDLVARWSEIQKSDFSLSSPYFRPEFTQAVAKVREDVFISLLEHKERVVGFFPFHMKRGGIARSIGLGLSDYQGVIAEADSEWTSEELMNNCKIVRWEFDHLLVGQQQFVPYHSSISNSPIIDISQGMGAFEASRDKHGRKQLREVRRKGEKLEEQVGPLTFSFHSSNEDILKKLFEWKSDQCQRTGTVDFFALNWCVKLIKHIHSIQSPDFGGILSCLHSGETLAAVHFSMYSGNVWHSWFPAYNHELEKYSPGFILLLEMIKSAADQDIKYIDLGKGISLYKKRVMTSVIPVADGCIEVKSFQNRLWHIRKKAENWGRQSWLKPVLRIPGRIIKQKEMKERYE